MLINKRKSVDLMHCNNLKVFTEYSIDIKDIYTNTDKCYPNKTRKILFVFGYMITDRLNNMNLYPVATELSIRARKLNMSLVFIMQSSFAVTKNIRLNLLIALS